MTENTEILEICLEGYLQTPKAAKFLDLCVGTMQNYRKEGGGPKYHPKKRKTRTMYLYEIPDLHAWARSEEE